MRVLLTAIGSPGDINPVVAVGQALQARGHCATMIVNPYFEDSVRQTGLEFIPLGTDEQLRKLNQTAFMRNPARRSGQRELVLPNAELLIETLDRVLRAEPPDLVVYHQLSLGAPWICRRYGVPTAVVTLTPLAWMSREDGSIHSRTGCRQAPPRWLLGLQLGLADAFLRWTLDRELNRIRRRYGLPPGAGFFRDHIRDCDLNLGLWSPLLRGPMPDDPPNGRICGFTWCDRGAKASAAEDEIREFLDQGEPPIVFTMGTSVITALGNFYETAAAACARLGRRGLLLIGSEQNRPRRLPPGVRAALFAPHSLVFPRASVNVHHGGAGTTAQALRAGKPTLVIPIAFDQFDNAERVRRLGISQTLWKELVSPRLLAVRLRSILESRVMSRRAAAIGAAVKMEDGAARAAALLEESVYAETSARNRKVAF